MEGERIVPFDLNLPQARALSTWANESYLLWGRGTGKTVGGIAIWILHKVEEMPRSNGGLLGPTFTDLDNKILPALFLAFHELGHEKDIHYVYGKRPPDLWPKSLTPIVNYSNVITFYNGTTVELISLHLQGSANGKSLQWIVGDEAKLLNETRLREEVFPVLRGHYKHFGKSPWYGAKLFVSDKLSPNIAWLLAKRKLHDERRVNTIIRYQLQYNELRMKLTTVSEGHAYKIREELRRLSYILAALRKQCVYFGEAKARDNIQNLGEEYFINMRRSLTDYEYRISIDNEDPTRAENGFYPDRGPQHLYYADNDEDVTKPVGVVLDYQASLSPLVAFQVNDLVDPGLKTLNFLESIYVKQPLGIKHVIDKYCEEHRSRPCKHVYYFYDHTAVAEQNMNKSYRDQVAKYFRDNGWTVTSIYMGAAPGHSDKYTRIQHFLQKGDPMPVFMHKTKCASMILAMDLTATKETNKGTKKDKSREVEKEYPQEQATHFSDCFDQAVWAVLELNLYPASVHIPMRLGAY